VPLAIFLLFRKHESFLDVGIVYFHLEKLCIYRSGVTFFCHKIQYIIVHSKFYSSSPISRVICNVIALKKCLSPLLVLGLWWCDQERVSSLFLKGSGYSPARSIYHSSRFRALKSLYPFSLFF